LHLVPEGMPHMTTGRWLLGLLGVLLLTASGAGQDIVSVSVPAAPVEAAPVPVPTTTLGSYSTCDSQFCNPDSNLYWLYVHHGVKISFEMYGRVGPSFVTSGGELDDVLHTGVAFDFGVKSFCYDKERRGGWYGELGVDNIFNKSNNRVPLIQKFLQIDVIRDQGLITERTITTPGRDTFGITRLHRIYARIGGGYQYYWGGDCPDDARWYLDLGGGVRLGSTRAGLHLLKREFLEDFQLQPTDVIQTPAEMLASDFIKNFYIGGGIGMLIPYCGFDVTAELHWEYSHDIIRLPTISNRDDGLDQVKVEAMAGLRW
jgi:hypothetical protein